MAEVFKRTTIAQTSIIYFVKDDTKHIVSMSDGTDSYLLFSAVSKLFGTDNISELMLKLRQHRIRLCSDIVFVHTLEFVLLGNVIVAPDTTIGVEQAMARLERLAAGAVD